MGPARLFVRKRIWNTCSRSIYGEFKHNCLPRDIIAIGGNPHVMIDVITLSYILHHPTPYILKQVNFFASIVVITNCPITTKHLHITNLPFSRIEKRTIILKSIMVPVEGALLTGEDEDHRKTAWCADSTLLLSP